MCLLPQERFVLLQPSGRPRAGLGCHNNVKRRDMNTIDLEGCLILERLGAELPGAQVEYERSGGMHRFVIVHGALSYEVGFPERLLEVCSATEIDRRRLTKLCVFCE